jgi:hypothetical protein
VYRLVSRRRLGKGGPAGAIRGYAVGAYTTLERGTCGIQLAAFLVRRCRLCSGDACLCTVLTEYVEELCGEQ